MPKQLFILLGVLSIQIYASYGVEDSNVDTKAAIEEEIKLDDRPYGVAAAIGNTKDTFGEGTRQKRFYDYLGYGTGASTFSSVYSSIPSSDIPYSTNVPNEQNKLSEILTILQKLAEITRPQYSPQNHHTATYPVFIPFNYIAQSGCTCTQSNANNPTTATPAASQTTNQPPATNYIPPSTNKPGNNTMPNLPDLGSRLGEESTKDPVSGDEDGVRPINFVPIPPKVPQTVESPPVEHGSFQAGLDPIPPVYNPPRDTSNNPLPEYNNMEAKIPQKVPMPSVCEGAILTCCHRAIVENKCFAQEGCGELDYKNPCDTAVLSSIVTKFRAYFKQRG